MLTLTHSYTGQKRVLKDTANSQNDVRQQSHQTFISVRQQSQQTIMSHLLNSSTRHSYDGQITILIDNHIKVRQHFHKTHQTISLMSDNCSNRQPHHSQTTVPQDIPNSQTDVRQQSQQTLKSVRQQSQKILASHLDNSPNTLPSKLENTPNRHLHHSQTQCHETHQTV